MCAFAEVGDFIRWEVVCEDFSITFVDEGVSIWCPRRFFGWCGCGRSVVVGIGDLCANGTI